LAGDIRAAMLPKYQALSDVDRETVEAQILLRPR